MIHELMISWPNLSYSSNILPKDVKGDTCIFNVTCEGLDLAEYKIKASLTDYGREIKRSNEAAGGSDDEIKFLDGLSGESKFQIIFPADSTENFLKYGTLEIQVESPEGYIFTICKQEIWFLDENIDW